MRRKNLAHHVGSLDRQLGWQQKLRECRQITFVTLNGFCPLNPPTPLFLTDNIKMDRIPTKIKCKIHAPFILTKFYKTQLARYLVLIQTIQTVTKFYLQVADKKLTTTVFPLLFREAYSLGRFAKLTRGRNYVLWQKKSNISVTVRFLSLRGGLCI